MADIKIYGFPFSPFVRKTLMYLHERGIDYDLVPTAPRSEDPEFTSISPLGKIPAMRDGDFGVADSSVIIAYLERKFSDGGLVPAEAKAAAKALWAEEYVDGKLVGQIGGHLFVEVVLAKAMFKREPIQADIDLALNEEVPAAFSNFEAMLTDDYIAGPEFTVGDCAVAAILTAFYHSQQTIGDEYPKLQAYWQRVSSRPGVAAVIAMDSGMLQQVLQYESPLLA